VLKTVVWSSTLNKRHSSFLSRIMVFTAIAMALALSAGIWGCSDDNGTANPDPSQGELKMYMVDTPGDYDAVNIVVTEVSVHMTTGDTVSGWWIISDSTRTINLLRLTNGNYDILGSKRLDVGHYSQIRLKIGTGSNVVVDGIRHDLDIPSGSQSGLKLNHAFDIEADALYELTLDFDASRSIHVTGNGRYSMRPVIRVIANVVSGSISGVVSPAISFAQITTTINLDTVMTYADALTGSFKLMVLPAGTYSVGIISGNVNYADSTVTGVNVIARQNTDIGTITLR